jgi:RHS repeat-associated protein
MFKKHFKITFVLLFFILVTSVITSTALSGSVFGPKQYIRTSGAPNTYMDTFQSMGGAGSLIIKNGSPAGNARVEKTVIDNSITSAKVYLNGIEIFGPNDFKNTVYYMEKSVQLNNGTNTLTVVLSSSPGSYITAEVTGNVPTPTVTISASPASVITGASSTLTWTSTNATSCSINQGIGTVATSGSKTVAPAQTTTYTITATGAGGMVTSNVTVTVIPPPTVTISANPASINAGASSALTWSSTNATSCSINQGIGTIATSGSKTVAPAQTTTYTITATGVGGTTTANVTVTVTNPNNPPYVTISAIPNEITTGGSTQLSWSSSGGQRAYIDNGVGVVALSGTVTVSPTVTTTYKITVSGSTGNASAEAIVTVKGTVAALPAGSFGEKYSDFIPKDATIAAYDTKRFSMVTGIVQNISGAPLSGVAVHFNDHPEYGTSYTDANGRFSIPIDGGTTMTLTYKKQGLITAQRQVYVPWNGYAVAETLKMIVEDNIATTITFDGNASTVKTHQSTMYTDSFGSRSTTIVFKGDNQAYLTDKDGNPVQTLNTINVRATEYTTPDSMPAKLPPNSAYTFCSELTVDGAERVQFQKPVVIWVENFLGFSVGSVVPVGYYDRDRGVWVPSNNGVVVQLLDTDGDGIVDAIDATGNGQSTDIYGNGNFQQAVIGLGDPSKYKPGTTYWRVEVTHFTPWDCNWPYGPPPDARPPNPNGQPTDSQTKDQNNPCKTSGASYVEDRSRVVHEDIPIPGTDMTLHYASSRVKGYNNTISVPASGSSVPASLMNIIVRLEVAGRTFEQILPPQPNQKAEFVWDGLDVWGKQVTGSTNASISIGFEYIEIYYNPGDPYANGARMEAWGRAGGENVAAIRGQQEMYSWINYEIALPEAVISRIADGWTLSPHHYLTATIATPLNAAPLYKGDGTIINNSYGGIDAIAGNGTQGYSGDNGPAVNASLDNPLGLAFDAIGNMYIAEKCHVRKVDTNGIITTVVGKVLTSGNMSAVDGEMSADLIIIPATGPPPLPDDCGYSGDGGPAVNALLNNIGNIAVDAIGNLYIVDFGNSRIRKVDTNGIITTVAGNGTWGYSGDGGPAVNAQLYMDIVAGIAVDAIGNLYIADPYNARIRKVDTSGIISTIAGNGTSGYSGDGGPAVNAELGGGDGLAVDIMGNLYIVDNNVIRKVDISGIITTIAGNGTPGYSGDGGPAINAQTYYPAGLAVDVIGNLYFADLGNLRIRKVDTNGNISTIAGNGTSGHNGDGGPAVNAQIGYVRNVAVDVIGNLYIVDNNVIRGVTVYSPIAITGGEIFFADDNNGLGYIFSSAGLHKKTFNLNTGVVLKTFGYNDNNQLISITDQFGRQTLINVDANGTATSITSPDGITTNLSIDSNSHLTGISYPNGSAYSFAYTSNGLLTTKTEPNGNQFGHTFDSSGKLTVASDQEGGNWQFNQTSNANGDVISTVTTGEGVSTTYQDHTYSTGAFSSVITDSTGAQTTYAESASGLDVTKSLSCGTNLAFTYDVDSLYKFKVVKQMTESTPANLQKVTTYNTTYADTNGDGVLDYITKTITQNGKATIIVQNTLAAQKTVTSPEGRIVTSFYNPANLLTTKLTIPNLYDTNYGYNTNGRLTSLNRNTRTTTLAYNQQGFLQSVTDPENKTVSYNYDAVGRVLQINRPDSSTIGFTYDPNGNMTVIRTPSAVNHGFGYNNVNLNSAYLAPLSGSYSYVYNKDRQLKQTIFPSGLQINNIYTNGLLTQMQTPEGNIDYTYLCSSKIGSITKGAENITYAYDGKLLTAEQSTGTLNQTLAYSYNNDFNPISFTYAGGTANYTYDNDGLLTGAGAFTITRDAQNGLPQSVADASLTLNRTFDGYSEQSAEAYNIGGRNVTTWNLTYTDAGKISTKSETVDGITANYIYTYDLMGRLTNVTKDGVSIEQYQYGQNGARTSETNTLRNLTRSLTYSAEDHLITAGTTTYQYDVDGFLQQRNNNGAITSYDYSSRGELLKATLPDGKILEYINDPRGRRIATMVNGVITEKYLWQGLTRLLAIYDGADNLITRFNYADGRMPYSMTSGGSTYYLTYDQVGSLRLITDSSGNTVKRIDYDSFGNIITDTNPQFNVMFGFAGGLTDPDTGLIRFGYRDYNPDTGRWIAKDPIFFAGGDTDLYGYVLNDPIHFTDPYGLSCKDDIDDIKKNYDEIRALQDQINQLTKEKEQLTADLLSSGYDKAVFDKLQTVDDKMKNLNAQIREDIGNIGKDFTELIFKDFFKDAFKYVWK